MCGIAGATRNLLGDRPERTLYKMNDVMLHRGPDMGEVVLGSEIGLCHRRLSIQDLSEDGRQPMSTADGRYTIVFNGEIYNFLELRKELQSRGYKFHSKTDTEVLLYLYVEHGPASLNEIRGMFSYAIWDGVEKSLFIARDRIGKKPLYYYAAGNKFAFASEIKSLLEIDQIPRDFDYTAFIDYLKYLFIPHPKSIYTSIQKLAPGHYLLFQDDEVKIKQYWDIDFSVPLVLSPDEIVEELGGLIRDAVQSRMLADVPLGAFLSGGIDSSGIVAHMAQISPKPVITCTIGFAEESCNEAVYAKNFASTLHTNHFEHYIEDEPAKIIRKLVWHFDEPFADSSMVPTYYVSQMAKKNVTVALSGDGGDESFAGYSKYGIDRYENMAREWIPRFILATLGRTASHLPGRNMQKVNSLCSASQAPPDLAFYVTNTFLSDLQLKKLLNPQVQQRVSGYDPANHISKYYRQANGPDHLAKILYTDLKLYLPGDILVKVDRMSMANSLEVRSPLLDHKIIEYAAKIPSALKMKGSQKKHILKQTFGEILPEDVLTRPKRGFVAPIDQWFRNELKPMAETSLLHSEHMNDFFNLTEVSNVWEQHQHGKADQGVLLWTLFMFSLWLEQTL